MEKNIEKTLDNFVNEPQTEELKNTVDNIKKVVLNEREGLIERVDKILVTSDGRQLLREQY